MKSVSRIAWNSVYSFLLNVSLKASNVLVFILISHTKGVEQAGIFSLATIYLLVLSAIMVGLDELVVRQVARDYDQAKIIFSNYLVLRILLSVFSFLLLVIIVSYLMPYTDTTRNMCLILGLCLIPDGIFGISQALLAAYGKFGISLLGGVISGITKILGAIFFLLSGYGLIAIGIAWLAGSWLGAVIVLIATIRKLGGIYFPEFPWKLSNFPNPGMNFTFLAISLISVLEFQLDVFFLSKMQGEYAVGLYSAVTTVTSSLTLISQAFRSAIYPVMIQLHKTNVYSLGRIYQLSMFGLGVLALPIVVGLILLGPRIVVWIYSPRFVESGYALQIISVVILFLFLGVPNWRTLLILEKQKTIALLWLFGLSINIGLNVILIPLMSINGAAIARIVSEFVSFSCGYAIASRLANYHQGIRDLLMPGLAAFGMGVVVWFVRDLAIWVPVLVGIVVYFLLLLFLASVSTRDRGLIQDYRNIFRRILHPVV